MSVFAVKSRVNLFLNRSNQFTFFKWIFFEMLVYSAASTTFSFIIYLEYWLLEFLFFKIYLVVFMVCYSSASLDFFRLFPFFCFSCFYLFYILDIWIAIVCFFYRYTILFQVFFVLDLIVWMLIHNESHRATINEVQDCSWYKKGSFVSFRNFSMLSLILQIYNFIY